MLHFYPFSMSPLPSAAFTTAEQLPDPLPADPFPLFKSWLDDAVARRVQPNPNAFALATADCDGRPSARMVLCKGLDAARAYIVFYSNYESRKGRDLAANPRAGAVFHWDALDRQVRLEGPIVKSPPAESDAYFASRPWEARVGAWASRQSEPIESREKLVERIGDTIVELGLDLAGVLDENARGPDVPRPPHWGGYRLWAERVELWLGSKARLHDRAAWTRTLAPAPDGFTGSAWTATRLQP